MSRKDTFSLPLPFEGIHAAITPRSRRATKLDNEQTLVKANADVSIIRTSDLEDVTSIVYMAAIDGNPQARAITDYLRAGEFGERIHERLAALGLASSGRGVEVTPETES